MAFLTCLTAVHRFLFWFRKCRPGRLWPGGRHAQARWPVANQFPTKIKTATRLHTRFFARAQPPV